MKNKYIKQTRGENSHLLMAAAAAGAWGRRKDYQSLDPPGEGKSLKCCFSISRALLHFLIRLTSDSSESDSRPYMSASFLNLLKVKFKSGKIGIPRSQISKLYD